MKSMIRYLCLCLLIASANANAWTGADLDLLSTEFVEHVPNSLSIQRQGWQFLTLTNCFDQDVHSCWGENPDSPYGVPIFQDTGTMTTRLRKDEAIVFIIKTPPAVRYFSFIPYLHTRTTDGVPKTLFASIDEPLNNLKIVTTGSSVPGDAVFNQLSVVVMTPNLGLYYQIQSIFDNLGFPKQAVQLLALPPAMLNLGQDPQDDSLTMLMRAALPADNTLFTNYISTENPVHVYRLTPITEVTNPLPAPLTALTVPGSGAENSQLQTARTALIADIRNHFQAWNITQSSSTAWAPIGRVCIQQDIVCGGDNYDALYTNDAQNLVNDPGKTDFTLIVGVNHHLLNKAVYLNHVISDPVKQAGVASFTDKDLAGSAAYFAGITDPNDPRNVTYRDLYAYAIASNCNGMQYCLEVPQVTSTNPIGIANGANYDIVGRIYLDPTTTVRPSKADIILPTVLFFSNPG